MNVERECGKAIRLATHASAWPFSRLWRSSRLCVGTALRKNLSGVPYAWIVDDCTLVPSRRRVVEIVRFIIEQGPAHGLYPNMDKFHAWYTRSDRGSMDAADELQQLGVSVSTDGLDRLQSALTLFASALVAIWTGSLLRLRISFLLYLQLHTPKHSIICYGGVHRILCTIALVYCRRTLYESLLKNIVIN